MNIERSSGILMPISSLPSKYGIGTLGQEAYNFIDFLYEANQRYWQILPVGQLSYGDSPYQSFSTFAGNPYFVDLEELIDEGLLKEEEVSSIQWQETEEKVDYGKIYEHRFDILHLAYERGIKKDRADFNLFLNEKKEWIEEYALFMALKRHFNMRPWTEWPDDIRLHQEKAVVSYRESLKEEIEFLEYIQFLFFKQWNELKDYAVKKGIGIIGDIPIYVALDSADVWANPAWFYLDENNQPIEVAGCPPDSFSADGQLWGNPLYRWDEMKKDGYGWWIRRIGGAFDLYDVLRIDHFRGFESYWTIPFGETTAKNGKWVKGPGMDLIGRLTSWFKNNSFIAEDLGYLTSEVKQLLEDSGLPGMKVIEFAFDSREASNYLPHTYTQNSVCYVGTHDNVTLVGWKEDASKEDIEYAKEYLGLNDKEGFSWGFLRGGMSSVSNLFIAQMQDYLELGSEARINTPGIPYGNWQWRMKKGANTTKLAKKIAKMTILYERNCHK